MWGAIDRVVVDITDGIVPNPAVNFRSVAAMPLDRRSEARSSYEAEELASYCSLRHLCP